MNIFPIRRREALAQLRLPADEFEDLTDDDGSSAPEDVTEPPVQVSPVNELATSLVEHDIADAVRADNPPPPTPIELPAPLSQRHLETIDRMVLHLKSDEHRLEKEILDAKRQLADTQLARRAYERNSAELRNGITVLTRLANTAPATRRPRRPTQVSTPPAAAATDGLALQSTDGGGATIMTLSTRTASRRRKVH
jgi:hypothetical protein